MNRSSIEYVMNAILVYILCGIITGAFYIHFFHNEIPCPLCLLQRVGMLGVALGALLNLFYGLRPRHYGLSLLSCLVGGAIALRQILLHICGAIPPYGVPVFGLSLYTWSFLTFASAVLYITFLLFLHNSREEGKIKMSLLANSAMGFFLFVVVVNLLTTLVLCGLGPCEE